MRVPSMPQTVVWELPSPCPQAAAGLPCPPLRAPSLREAGAQDLETICYLSKLLCCPRALPPNELWAPYLSSGGMMGTS